VRERASADRVGFEIKKKTKQKKKKKEHSKYVPSDTGLFKLTTANLETIYTLDNAKGKLQTEDEGKQSSKIGSSIPSSSPAPSLRNTRSRNSTGSNTRNNNGTPKTKPRVNKMGNRNKESVRGTRDQIKNNKNVGNRVNGNAKSR